VWGRELGPIRARHTAPSTMAALSECWSVWTEGTRLRAVAREDGPLVTPSVDGSVILEDRACQLYAGP
jgi:hypothetical protein